MKLLRKLLKSIKQYYPGYKKIKGLPGLIHPLLDVVYELKVLAPGLIVPIEIPLQNGEYVGVTIAGTNHHLHRLKAERFLPKPPGVSEKLIVNHKDGIKTNNSVENYEWVSYSGNIIHAYKSGLRNDNISGTMYDLIDGTSYDFYSYADLSRHLGINGAYITYYMKRPRDYPFRRRYVIVPTGTERPNITKEDIWKSNENFGNPIYLLDTITGEKSKFGNFASMVKTLGLKYYQREKFIPGKEYVFGNGKHIVTLMTEYDEIISTLNSDPVFSNRDYSHLNYKKDRNKVSVMYPNGGVKIFKNVEIAAKELGSTDCALSKRIHSFKGLWKGHVLTYI